jgi:hypothetical protein
MLEAIIKTVISNIWFNLFSTIVIIFIILKNFKQDTKKCVTDKTKKANRISCIIILILGIFTIISVIAHLILRHWILANLSSGSLSMARYLVFSTEAQRFLGISTIIFFLVRLLILFLYNHKIKQHPN